MSALQIWGAVAAVALLGFALKGIGPLAFGGRELPPRARLVLAMLAPALLAGFVAIELAGPGWSKADATVGAGVAAGVGLRLLRAPLPLVMLGAAVATGLLRWGLA
ncbi:branched-chain amino acid ABC transporter [Streptomyces triticagri]|uniref:Branched-chain amino acid ABC transporter n=1 Tax=Streptomyces triticagri TaxID=2293568 RepID=A0A372M6L6_9ACTN|nr:AzlD domain-containing protein [Streptomyces triticagri]RFU85937.1 branched-chain amino acid ABC transporter [Streptomyces triticagri]